MKKIVVFGMSVLLIFAFTGCGKCEHEYDKGTITKQPTCTEEGEREFTCSLCGKTKVEKVDKESHQYEEEVTKEATFKEKGEKTVTCRVCGDSYTESIPVRDDEVDVIVTNKSNLPKDTNAGRFSDRVEFAFDVRNRTDRVMKGVQGNLKVCDLFGEEILTINCDFVGNSIPANASITVNDLGMDVNPFVNEHVKFYNTDFSDLKFEYKVTNIVYDDGSSMNEQSSAEIMESQKVMVAVTDKQSVEANYSVRRYYPRVQFIFEVFNHTSKDIRGVQGVMTIKDLFGVDIMSLSVDFTGQTIPANGSVIFDDLGLDVNEFMDEHIKVYNTAFEDLNFEYEVTSIVYSDGTTE